MYLYRSAISELIKWKKQTHRMPLILRGPRQVGKTYLVREFAKNYPQFHEFNFQKDQSLATIFKSSNDPQKIVSQLSILCENKIDLCKDLIFFDEIQDCPEALNSLKFFSEDYPKSNIIAAGSLFGIYLSNHTFPVGKVEFKHIYPLTFYEFLKALGKNQFAEVTLTLSNDINAFHETLISFLNFYFIIGGMPKAITTYLTNMNFNEVRSLQDSLLISYKADFAKYSGSVDALKILSIFENIPRQLAKDNRKFKFNLLKSSGRYSEFSSAIDWLVNAGLALKVPIITHAEIPLKIHQEENMFKLYFFDVGLLGALSELPTTAFANKDGFFKTFKGAFSENFFVQDFTAQRSESLYCWQGKTSEVDFLFNNEMTLVPVEVKSGEFGKLKSLSTFAQKYSIDWRTRCSLRPFEIRNNSKIKNIPLYQSFLV